MPYFGSRGPGLQQEICTSEFGSQEPYWDIFDHPADIQDRV
jgi:hypothetical protein